ncbi:MAG: mannose-6-phosphate isomerase [Bacteroidia bacterium]|nr:MAG: mannose-6-phosphate isomerase [Bacteroidia bacterium]PIE86500.1 MAG: mannose-6-phosphate isomerase [Bacteroidia bacterium]
MSLLYPLKFQPIFKSKIWGGNKIKTELKKDIGDLPNCGESWEISGVQDNLSEVANGFLAGNNIEELIEIYMGDLVGEKNYEKYGIEFPLLVKFIDASDFLSIQVHPDNKLAKQRHNAYGKIEMWYVLSADEGAQIITGFNTKIDKKEYIQRIKDNSLIEVLHVEEAKSGDSFLIPFGRIHAIGAGILLTEIQQTSDITYRIYDYERKDAEGNTRELHTDLSIDAIDFQLYDSYKSHILPQKNAAVNLTKCDYFKTGLLEFDEEITRDYSLLDSFVIYVCVEGKARIKYRAAEDAVEIQKGETVLIPASFQAISLAPEETTRLLEVFIP